MEDWNAPKHQWPSGALVSAISAQEFENPKQQIVLSVWNAISHFSAVANSVEGGFMPMADNNGDLQPFFAGQILPALKLETQGEASAAFGRLLMRDLSLALGATGEAYGPGNRHSAYLAIDTFGELMCAADLPGQARRSFKHPVTAYKAA